MPLHDRTVSTHMNDPISRQAIDEIVRGTHGAPFDVLGPHLIEPGELVPELVPKKASSQRGRRGDANAPRTVQSVVRAFFPGAKSATIIPLADGLGNGADGTREATAPETATGAVPLGMLPMRLLHPAGFFSGGGVDDFTCTPYAIEVEYDVGVRRRIRDPYAFAPQLSDFVLHLLGEGTDYEAYHHLGAHPRIVNGVAGVCFAVWAPNAKRVSVVGEFNHWDERVLPMRLRSGGIWELFVPDLISGMLYKYAILSWNMTYRVQKADPYAFGAEVRPGTASRVCNLDSYAWQDQDWMHARASRDSLAAPMSIYEVHAGSWQPDAAGEEERHTSGPVSYRGLAHQLVPYLLEMGYTHVELMPIAEYPFDGSWGYQVTGYYAPTSRYGVPQDFMYFVDYCHRHNIGVLLDWVPAHFPKDEHGLNYFDGSHLYEHADPRLGEHPDWGTLVFNFGRNEVANFLLANALFWLDMYHIDGLRVDAVASMLYLDYSRKAGEWMPNRHGGRENLEAVAFVRRFNELVHGRFPGTITIAEESTAWPMVSRPTYLGGLGFTYKWNMGWMHDILRYFAHDPIHRRFHHNELTFSLMYAFSENFILPFSHDEVVHIKGSLLNKMPGDVWQKTANLRALYAYMYGHPGKKLLFMGGEFGQWSEWNYAGWLDWHLLNPAEDGPSPHAQLQRLICDLNHLLRTTPALFERDFSPEGFEWIDCSDAENSIVSFMRSGVNSGDSLLIVCNFTPVPRYGYRVGVPKTAFWTEVLNTDSKIYGGSNVGNQGGVRSDPIAAHGHAQSILLTLPPLATMFFRSDPSEVEADAGEADKIPTTDTAPSHAEVSSRPRQSGARTSRASTSVNAPRQRDRMSVKARQAWDVNQHDATLG